MTYMARRRPVKIPKCERIRCYNEKDLKTTDMTFQSEFNECESDYE